jgi:hypothetical protein
VPLSRSWVLAGLMLDNANFYMHNFPPAGRTNVYTVLPGMCREAAAATSVGNRGLGEQVVSWDAEMDSVMMVTCSGHN